MRVNHLVMLLAVGLVGLSGCLGFGDDEPATEDDECPTDDHAHDNGNATDDHGHECPDESNGEHEDPLGNQTDVNQTEGPNELPMASLSMTLDDGSAVDETTGVMAGSNITFDASNSTDADGQIDLIGLTVVDRNNTRTAQLFDDGSFVTATFKVEHEGPVNVTLRVLDDRGEATILETFTSVNRIQTSSVSITGAEGAAAGSADSCESPSQVGDQGTISGDATGKGAGFQVAAGAQWIEATQVSGDGDIAICSPDGTALSGEASGEGARVFTNEGVELPSAIDYYVMVLSGGSPDSTYDLEIVVHHEPRPAEP